MPQVDINAWAVVAGIVIFMVLGGLWYSPMLFGKAWMKLSGLTPDKMKKEDAYKGYIGMIVSSFLIVYVLSHLLGYAGAKTFTDGMTGGFWVWLGFVAPILAGSVFWEGKPWKWWLLNAGYHLVALLIVGGMIAAW